MTTIIQPSSDASRRVYDDFAEALGLGRLTPQTNDPTPSSRPDSPTQVPRLIGPSGDEIELPVELYEVLRQATDELRRGYAVTVMPLAAVLTTSQAAELLNVSRPHVVKLLEEGLIEYHKAGTHRRVRLTDLLEYKAKRDEEQHQALAEMHAIADEAGMEL